MSGKDLSGQSVLLAGCGDIGTGLGERLVARGARVCGLRRQPEKLPDSFEKLAADFSDPASLAALQGREFDQVVITLTPTAYTDEAYALAYVTGLENLLDALQPGPGFLFFVSSTSVYGQDDHNWVDETSATEPATFAGIRMLAAEGLVANHGVPHTIVRAAGIYGPGRTRLLDQVRAGNVCEPEHRLYTNRIHREDLIGFLAHLVAMRAQGTEPAPCYLATDSHAATLWDVQCWLARQMDPDPLALQKGPSPGRTSKRCRNTRLRESGYTLRYPDFMRGYGDLLAPPEPPSR